MDNSIHTRPVLVSSPRPLQHGISLRSNMSWTIIGYGVYTICQWGMLVAIAKIGSPEMVGQFALGLAITAPVMMFASLNMRIIQATDAKGEYQFTHYLSVRTLTTAFAFFAVIVIALLARYPQETLLVILAIGLAKSFESISDIFHGLFQFNERMDRVSISLLIKGPLSLFALVFMVYLTGSVFWGSIGLAITWLLILFIYDIRNGNRILKDNMSLNASVAGGSTEQGTVRLSSDWKSIRNLIWLGLPMGLAITLNSLDTNIPRYFVEGYYGEVAIGIFAALAYFDRVGSTIVKALGESASPRMARYFANQNRKAYSILFLGLVSFGLLLGLSGILVALIAGRQVLTLFYSPEYVQLDLFLTLMVASGLGYVSAFIIYGISAARFFTIQLVLSVIVTGSLIITCYLIVPDGGLISAANALVISRIIKLVGSVLIAIFAFIKLLHSSK